ncbi:MAG TPA: hypothetical protein DEQ61_20000 [Streptomyces sp.]|nr:hypothetical protein [Streptomyces sp.]
MSTFGGVWTSPQADGRGHTARELADRASYDQAPPAGISCMTATDVLALALVGIALSTLIGALL